MAHIPQAIADYITFHLAILGFIVTQGNVISNIIGILTILVLIIRGGYYVWKWNKDFKKDKQNGKSV